MTRYKRTTLESAKRMLSGAIDYILEVIKTDENEWDKMPTFVQTSTQVGEDLSDELYSLNKIDAALQEQLKVIDELLDK